MCCARLNRHQDRKAEQMPNPMEYRQSPVSKKEQVSLRSPEGKLLKQWTESVNPRELDGVLFQVGDRIVKPIPKESGVYFALYDSQPVYVGQSCCLHRRMHDFHLTLSTLKRCGLPIYFAWALLPRSHRLKAETLLVRRFKPLFNSQSAESPELARAIIQEWMDAQNSKN